ncbi:hypothetical protein TCON_0135 [Astathelohania contejeani]|uniref:Uncharacterized protein n=1 Tax=Astathelohania contejeani TaxID=164912 RepID=A0ABQ7I2K5_9MICR|nr:hypothetical protein TCON_0135 [Thelohania contejeani]
MEEKNKNIWKNMVPYIIIAGSITLSIFKLDKHPNTIITLASANISIWVFNIIMYIVTSILLIIALVAKVYVPKYNKAEHGFLLSASSVIILKYIVNLFLDSTYKSGLTLFCNSPKSVIINHLPIIVCFIIDIVLSYTNKKCAVFSKIIVFSAVLLMLYVLRLDLFNNYIGSYFILFVSSLICFLNSPFKKSYCKKMLFISLISICYLTYTISILNQNYNTVNPVGSTITRWVNWILGRPGIEN